jgi:hypothetical protein
MRDEGVSCFCDSLNSPKDYHCYGRGRGGQSMFGSGLNDK